MFNVIRAFNIIEAHRLLTTHYHVLSNSYRHQTTYDFEKVFDLEGVENTSIITASIVWVFRMYIEPTRLLEDSALNTKFDADGKLCTGSIGWDQDDNAKIEKAITVGEDNKDKEEDP